MKLSSAVPEIIDVLRHGHRGLARLMLFNLVISEPLDSNFTIMNH